MKTGKDPLSSEVSLELTVVSMEITTQVMADLCLEVLAGMGMPVEWDLSIVVSIFEWKGDIKNYSCYKAMNLIEHGIKLG